MTSYACTIGNLVHAYLLCFFFFWLSYFYPLQPSTKPVVRSFRDVFLDFRYDAVPSCSGPRLFLSDLDQQYVLLLSFCDRFSVSGFNCSVPFKILIN